ncbi:MAG: hypothetical protein IJS09_11040 [Treponema sp.]|nr:hypothetical protein [Treponema sp.]
MANFKTKLTKLLIIPLAFFCVPAAFAQEEAIALPDVTTVVSGGAITAGKDSVPDYSPVLPDVETARVELPQVAEKVAEAPAPDPEPTPKSNTKFRVGGGLYTGFPFGDNLMREKIAAGFAGELPFTVFDTNKEFGGAARLLLGGVIGKEGVSGGFAGELSLELFFRLPVNTVFILQPSFGYGLALTCVDGSTFFDSDLPLSCSMRFVPQGILDGRLEFAFTPVLHWTPFSDNSIFGLGIKLGALYSFKK